MPQSLFILTFYFEMIIDLHGSDGGGLVAMSCLTVATHGLYSLPSSSVHGISQATILGWLPFPAPRDLPDPGI